MLDASRRGIVTEVTVRVAASRRAAFDGLMTRQQCMSASVAELNEHDGEKLVDGPGVLDLQRATAKMTAKVGRDARCLGVSWRGLDQA